MKILLIEDDLNISSFIKIGLELHNHIVHAVSDGLNGLKLTLSGKYDIIVLDTENAGYLDLELCKNISNNKKSTPLIMLTSLESVVRLITGLDYSGNDYLIKPFSFDELLERLNLIART